MDTDNQPNALDLLVQQHDDVDALFARMQGELEGDQKMFVFFELADKLSAHAAMEEQIFYPAVRELESDEILLEFDEEHRSIKRALADLLGTEVNDDRFDGKLAFLMEEVRFHAREEEEQELFPRVRSLMSDEELESLGGQMQSRYEHLLATHIAERSEARKHAQTRLNQ